MIYLIGLIVILFALVFLADVVFGADRGRYRPRDVYGDQLEKHGPPHQPDSPDM